MALVNCFLFFVLEHNCDYKGDDNCIILLYCFFAIQFICKSKKKVELLQKLLLFSFCSYKCLYFFP